MSRETYLTSFCNKPHFIKTGRPAYHQCFRLNVVKLALEREGKIDEIKGHTVRATCTDPRDDKNE